MSDRSHTKWAIQYIPLQSYYGLFATANIPAGETIIVDKPFFAIPPALMDDNNTCDLLGLWNELDETAKIDLLSFTPRGDHDMAALRVGQKGLAFNGLLRDIVKHNGVILGNDPDPKGIHGGEEPNGRGMFKMIGRVNHSCGPNSVWRWCKEGQQLYLIACYDIPAKTEITASYIPALSRPIGVRQNELRRQYGFTCTCRVCTASPAEIEISDTKLQRYQTLAQHWDNPDDLIECDKWCSDYFGAMAELAEAKGILRDEGKFETMGDVLEEMWLLNVYHGRKEEAIRAGREMLGFYSMVEGETWARDGGGMLRWINPRRWSAGDRP